MSLVYTIDVKLLENSMRRDDRGESECDKPGCEHRKQLIQRGIFLSGALKKAAFIGGTAAARFSISSRTAVIV